MSDFWQEFAMKLLLEAIPILVPVGIALIFKWAAEIWSEIKIHRPEFLYNLEKAVAMAVNAAEQVGLTGALAEYGQTKLEYAIEVAQKFLKAQGITKVDLKVLVAAIEDAVKKAEFPHMSAEG